MRYMVIAQTGHTAADTFNEACDIWQNYECKRYPAKVMDTQARPAKDVTAQVCLWHLSWVRTHRDQDMNEASYWLLDAMDRLAEVAAKG